MWEVVLRKLANRESEYSADCPGFHIDFVDVLGQMGNAPPLTARLKGQSPKHPLPATPRTNDQDSPNVIRAADRDRDTLAWPGVRNSGRNVLVVA
jgi:hypothetical protein